MDNDNINKIIRETVQAELPGARVILFGSRAIGNYDASSDYDLLIITPNTLEDKDKIAVYSKLDRAIRMAIHKPIDLLINSEEEVQQKMLLPGHIIRSVFKHGIII